MNVRALIDRIPAPVFTILLQAVVLGSQFGVDILIARHVDVGFMGDLVFAFGLAGLLSIFMLFGAGEVSIDMYRKHTFAVPEVLTAGAAILCAGASAAVVLGVAALALVAPGWQAAWLTAITMLTLAINSASSLLSYILVAHEKTAGDFAAMTASRAVLVAGAVGGIAIDSTVMIMASFPASAATLLVLRVRLVRSNVSEQLFRWNSDCLAALWDRSRQLGIGSIFGTVSARADLMVLRKLSGAAQTGLYGTSYRLINGVSAGASATSFALFPYLSGSDRRSRRFRRLYWVLAGLIVLPTLALAAWGTEWILSFVFGEAYAAAAPMLRILFVASAVETIYTFGARWLLSRGREKWLPRAQVTGAAVNVALLLIFVPAMGGVGAAWATLAAFSTQLAVIVVAALTERWSVEPFRMGAIDGSTS